MVHKHPWRRLLATIFLGSLIDNVPAVRANNWLIQYDACDATTASSAVVSPMDVCVQTELRNYQQQSCQVDPTTGDIYVQTKFWDNKHCNGEADGELPVMTKPGDCSGGSLFTCTDGKSSRAITHWPAVAKFSSLTDTCGTWADEVVAYNPNCTLGSDRNYRRTVCRENTLLYADYGHNCSSQRPTSIHEKYRVHHCSTSLSNDGPGDDDADDGSGGGAGQVSWGLSGIAGRFAKQRGRFSMDDDRDRWMYYASCGGATELPGVITPNDGDGDDGNEYPWWEITLIAIGAVLVLCLAIRVGIRLQGANEEAPNERAQQYALLNDEGLDKVRGADTHNDPIGLTPAKEMQYNASPSFNETPALNGSGSYVPPPSAAPSAPTDSTPNSRGKELVPVRSTSAERTPAASSEAAPAGKPLGTDDKTLKQLNDLLHTPV